MKELHLTENNIKELPDNFLFANKVLEGLDLSTNKISRLNRQVFGGLSRLQILSIGQNPIEQLPPDVFVALKRLESLYMEELPLQSLHKDIFIPLKQLQLLDLTNSLTYFSTEGIYQLPNLTILYYCKKLFSKKDRSLIKEKNPALQLYPDDCDYDD